MSFTKHSSARHRAETTSHAVRNTAVATVAAGAAVAGIMTPAQAAGEFIDFGNAPAQAPANFIDFGDDIAGYEAYMSSLGLLGGQTYQAPVTQSSGVSTQSTAPTPQPAAAATQPAAPAPQPAEATTQPSAPTAASGVSTQSTASSGGIVGTAYQGVGGSYVWGGTGFKAWDCSGFTQWAFAQNGIDVPRTTYAQIAAGTPTSAPKPGDLVSQNGGSHVGIYIGNGQMISALNPSQGTQVHAVNAMSVDGYYTF